MGMGGKQEQGQPWAESQFFGDGWQEQGQPWAECQFVGTEGKQGQGNRGISAKAERGRTAARQQGHFCVSRKGTDDSRIAGAFLRKQKGDGQQGSLRAECRSKKGRKANRAAFEGREP